MAILAKSEEMHTANTTASVGHTEKHPWILC